MKDYFLRRSKKNAIAAGDDLVFLLKKDDANVGGMIKTETCEQHDLVLFFQSIASTVQKFPPVNIAFVKKQINDVVSEMEIALNTPYQSDIQLVYKVQDSQAVIDMANV